ncbi:uncharacterized protein PHALS_14410 [Plasmopara halstedii]|uniref:Uncharacterized protein n=1 Tax=Plasmopara halstedii TaxID=4781 RepID=A0A0P1ARD4_PLAHL|nr:uncharacterized protein PHALS_14410 [Plasmopara halstedii]CEG44149.1 hypothetical protein PHALS_14410 [Plasmopara halstedii]|eukprot:XP_024580518.1 hypothetical protein PHALS_14410 [Plasmopara halstedii]
MTSTGNEAVELRTLTAESTGGGVPGTPNGPERDLNMLQEETEHSREEYLEEIQRRIDSYEKCAAAITAATTSLQKLSEHLDAMHQATQQLNAFTSGWLAVWKRPSA